VNDRAESSERAARLRAWAAQAPKWRDAWTAFGVGAAARAGAIAWAAGRFPPAGDGHYYGVIARRIAAGHGYTWLWPDGTVTFAAHYPVGYPALVGALYALFGAHLVLGMLLNAALGSFAVVGVHRVASSVSSRAGALLAALLVALHPALVMYTPALMTEGVVAALLALAGWLAVRAARGPGRALGRVIALGLLLGAATLIRPQTILLAPLFGVLAIRASDAPARRRRVHRLLRAAAVTAIAFGVCLPWTLRNCARMGRCVFVSANAGWNLLIGAGPGATGAWVALDRLGIPPRCRDVFGEADKDACFLRAAVAEIEQHPIHYLELVPAKLAVTFDYSGAPGWYLHSSNPRAFSERAKVGLGIVETAWERLSVLLCLAALAFFDGPRKRARRWTGALAALALFSEAGWLGYLGLVLTAALLGKRALDHPPAWLAAGTVALTALTHAVFFGAGRYSMVCFALVSALAGSALSAPQAGLTAKS
jgi:4-amino-4-deoxy-L-arabinose transferase-like glycosyltransferase